MVSLAVGCQSTMRSRRLKATLAAPLRNAREDARAAYRRAVAGDPAATQARSHAGSPAPAPRTST